MSFKTRLSAQDALLRLSKNTNEAEIRRKIATWLHDCGIECREEYQTGAGPTDLYSINQRFIIEIKRHSILSKGIHHRSNSSQGSESAFEQLCRYVNAERYESKLSGDDLQWIGIITDGIRWHAWFFPLTGEGDAPTSIGSWSDVELDSLNIKLLKNLLLRSKDKPSRDDLVSEFRGIHEKLKKRYNQRSSKLSTKTQKHLWLEQLKGSGNSPKPNDEDNLFVIHTMLILISRMVSGIKIDDNKLLEGFVSWAENSDEIKGIFEIVNRYNWNASDGDVLRQLYGGFIPKEQRRAYGEYYTPDWLAEKICIDVIDDEYIKKQLDRFNNNESVQGILDPACGSGTFLYHAGKHLRNSKPVKDAYMETESVDEFICAMIQGIDIHPVAVEMARANLHRLLSNMAISKLKIFQGDSLLINHHDASTILEHEGKLVLLSPNNQTLVIPEEFLKSQANINKFVCSAVDKRDLPKAALNGLSSDDKTICKKAHKAMTEIITNEGNGVWAWYIHNQSAPLLMADGEKMGRIVSNPPWVTLKRIDDLKRSEMLKGLGKKLEIYSGKKLAPQFDMASLFVVQCQIKYLHKNSKVGWVLPQSAMRGGGTME